ncbi:MAG: hypothetical protein KAQ63_02060 [Candidatus Moranbacteria bacterium]|nr:hypothetical protein [Candidatus Moranbacteria bacterium]
MNIQKILHLRKFIDDFDAYFSNNKVIAFFNLDEVFPPDSNEWPIYSDKQDVELFRDHRRVFEQIKEAQRQDDSFERYFHEVLSSKKVLIFSKIENKFIDTITRKTWKIGIGSLVGTSGYKYYLSNSILFFKCGLHKN